MLQTSSLPVLSCVADQKEEQEVSSQDSVPVLTIAQKLLRRAVG